MPGVILLRKMKNKDLSKDKMYSNFELERSIEKSIELKNLKSIIFDAGEFTIDSILENDALKTIPVFGTIHNICKVGIGIRDRIFLKKILRFLKEIAEIGQEDRLSMIEKLERDPKFRNRVGEYTIMLLDRIDDYNKVQMVSKAFTAFCCEKINVVELLRINQVIDRILLNDLPELKKLLAEESRIIEDDPNAIPELNFISLGLAYIRSGYGANSIAITLFGKLFLETVVN